MTYILLILMSFPSFADELSFGLITHHFFNKDSVSKKYSNCMSKNCATIVNPILAYRNYFHIRPLKVKEKENILQHKTKKTYAAQTGFVGVNSVNNPLAGYFISWGLATSTVKIGPIWGAYIQDGTEYDKRKINSFKAYRLGNVDIVPLVGGELQYKLTKKIYLNTIYSIVVTNIGLGYEF